MVGRIQAPDPGDALSDEKQNITKCRRFTHPGTFTRDTMTRQILCISLSEITRDARVLRQIALLAEFGEVTTVGFGEHPPGVAVHFQVPSNLTTLPQTPLGVLKLALRAHRSAECSSPAASWVLAQDIRGPWDLVVANEARVLDLANRLADGAPVWADLHEWAPGERTQIASWRLLVAPFMDYLCDKYLSTVSMSTTVSRGIIDLYDRHYGVRPLFMPNSGSYREIAARQSGDDVVRCVHSGAAQKGRALDTLVRVFRGLPDRFLLDLYLVPTDDGGYLEELKKAAEGCQRINFRRPVDAHLLPEVLSQYDLGVHWIPSNINLNNRFALPNKFFDYIQARIGIAIGPSDEMVRELRRYGLGVVAESFDPEDLAKSLLNLDAAKLNNFKENAAKAAKELSFEAQAVPVREALADLLHC